MKKCRQHGDVKMVHFKYKDLENGNYIVAFKHNHLNTIIIPAVVGAIEMTKHFADTQIKSIPVNIFLSEIQDILK